MVQSKSKRTYQRFKTGLKPLIELPINTSNELRIPKEALRHQSKETIVISRTSGVDNRSNKEKGVCIKLSPRWKGLFLVVKKLDVLPCLVKKSEKQSAAVFHMDRLEP